MKRLNIAIVALVASTVLSAQTVFEAVKFSNTDIVGSARYMGVAGAFGALGAMCQQSRIIQLDWACFVNRKFR